MKRISEILKEEREKKNYSFKYLEKETKIKSEYLAAIEEGKFWELPSEAYALGFVKNYAEFLGISKEKAAALFRREYKEEESEVLPEFRKNSDRFNQKSFFNPKIISILLLFAIFLGYIVFQYHSFLFGPPLTVESPKQMQIVKDNIVQINGKTDPYAVVFIEGEEVFVNLDGTFKKSLYVFPGDKKINIVAKNRVGKETKLERTVKVE